MGKKKIDQDIYAGIVILLACAGFFLVSLKIDNRNGAAVFPWILMTVMAAMGVWIIVQGVKRTAAGNPIIRITLSSLKIPAECYLYVIAYFILYWLFGYFIASAVFLVAYMRFLHVRSWKTIILVTIGYLVGVYVVFYLVFHVQIVSFGRVGRLLQGV